MKPIVSLIGSEPPDRRVQVARMVGLLLLLWVLAACPSSTPAPTPVDSTPTPTATPSVTPSPTPAIAPPGSIQPLFEVQVPSAPQIEAILEAAAALKEAPSHVPPPPQRIASLQKSYRILQDKGEIVNTRTEDVFNGRSSTTQAVPDPGVGAQFQLVSLASQEDDLQDPSNGWGDKAFVAGGILVYQDQEILIDQKGDGAAENYGPMPLPAGNYLVLLYRGGGDLTFALSDEQGATPITGYWQLRYLEKPTLEQPRSYLTEQQLCLGQMAYQPCLNVRAPAIGADLNRDLIDEAVQNLDNASLLPPDAAVNVAGAMADVIGAPAIDRCFAELAETEQGVPQGCQPSIVVAAIDPLPQDRLKLIEATGWKTPGLASMLPATALQTSVSITETAVPVAVMNVLETLPNDVFDWNGNPQDLNPNFYRVDLLYVPLQGRWLSQFVWSDNGLTKYLYAEAEEVIMQGEPVTGADQETTCDVVLSSFIVRPCRGNGTEAGCSSLYCGSGCHKKPYCLNRRRWC